MRIRWIAFFLAGACSNPSGTIVLTTGGETDTFTRSPVPTSLLVEAVQQDGTRTTLADAGLPATTIDLGSPSSSTVASIQVTARDQSGATVVSGASPFVELLALDGVTLPVFVQRDGELARMPGALPDSRSAALLSASDRGIYGAGGLLGGVADGGPPPIFGYDLVFLDQFGSQCQTTRSPRSMLLENAGMLLVDDSGATVVDLTSTPCTNADLGGLSDAGDPTWASVSGGATVYGDDGSGYIVGPSKPDSASNTIVKVDTSGNVTTASVNTPRMGAATAWVSGKGLFVYGGSSSGEGVEILSSSASVPRYLPDATAGLLAAQLDANTMLLVGTSVLEKIDLGCASASCTPQPWGSWPPQDAGVALTPTGFFAVATGVFVVVGDDAQGTTHVFRLDAGTTIEVPLKIQRAGARAVKIPTGAVVILGGGTTTLEAFVP